MSVTRKTSFADRFALTALLFLMAGLTFGASTNQSWSLRTWRAVDGLPDNTVVGIEQTPDGYLWIGTHAGLTRFDGVRFREFPPIKNAGQPTS